MSTLADRIQDPEVHALLGAPAAERAAYFVTEVARRGEAWGLMDDESWVSATSRSEGRLVLPMWPTPAFAVACIRGEWASSKPAPIALDQLLSVLLPNLGRENVLVGLMYDPEGRAVHVPAQELRHTLVQHLADVHDEHFEL